MFADRLSTMRSPCLKEKSETYFLTSYIFHVYYLLILFCAHRNFRAQSGHADCVCALVDAGAATDTAGIDPARLARLLEHARCVAPDDALWM